MRNFHLQFSTFSYISEIFERHSEWSEPLALVHLHHLAAASCSQHLAIQDENLPMENSEILLVPQRTPHRGWDSRARHPRKPVWQNCTLPVPQKQMNLIRVGYVCKKMRKDCKRLKKYVVLQGHHGFSPPFHRARSRPAVAWVPCESVQSPLAHPDASQHAPKSRVRPWPRNKAIYAGAGSFFWQFCRFLHIMGLTMTKQGGHHNGDEGENEEEEEEEAEEE